MEVTKCLLIISGVSRILWADTIITAAYIQNKCLSKVTGDLTQEVLWFKKEMGMSHLKVYGCKVWAVHNTQP